ncbi:MAG: methyltransferase [Candidatus Aminicenantes bacterium]|nr:methyltransferase [Candidatus Aminicenantes bacterium]
MSKQENLLDTNQPPSESVIPGIINNRIIPNLLYVAAKIGIADLLGNGPKSIDELAEAVKAYPQSLYRVLRTLASYGIFAENTDGQFELTPSAVPLQSDMPGSLRTWVILTGEDWFHRPFGELLYCVKTGKQAFNHVHGMSLFEYLKQDSEAAEIFNEVMTKFTEPMAASVAKSYDFSGISDIVDIGGGKGTLISAIMNINTGMHGILYDLPYVINEAKVLIEREGLSDRCKLVAGDMFESVPEGKVFILKRVLHDWDDTQCISILKNCRRSISDSGKLLVVEGVVPDGNAPSPLKSDDIRMMVVAGGLERTKAEFARIFNAAGFNLTEILPTKSTLSIIEAEPI